MKRKTAISIFILVVVALLLPSAVWAAAVGTTPGKLYFDSESGLKQTLNVINTGAGESNYLVYAEGEYEDWFEFSQREFNIESGNSEEIDITLAPPKSAFGEYEANICVIALDQSTDLNIGAGIKVPAYISVTESKTPVIQMWLILTIILPLLLITAVFYIWRRRKKIEVA